MFMITALYQENDGLVGDGETLDRALHNDQRLLRYVAEGVPEKEQSLTCMYAHNGCYKL
jgi:hypothetical protein